MRTGDWIVILNIGWLGVGWECSVSCTSIFILPVCQYPLPANFYKSNLPISYNVNPAPAVQFSAQSWWCTDCTERMPTIITDQGSKGWEEKNEELAASYLINLTAPLNTEWEFYLQFELVLVSLLGSVLGCVWFLVGLITFSAVILHFDRISSSDWLSVNRKPFSFLWNVLNWRKNFLSLDWDGTE